MKILFNAEEISVEAANVAELLREKQVPQVGVAVAVNNQVVRKAQWQSHPLLPGDSVTVITAVCGG